MIARTPALAALLLLAGHASTGLAADAGKDAFAPPAHPVDRYAAIWKRSPFIVETVAVQQSAGLATKYSLVGMATLANQPVVFLLDRNANDPAKARILVTKAHPSPAQIAARLELVSVALDRDPRKSSVVIRQGSEQASIPFDVSALPVTGPAPATVNNAAPASGIPMPGNPAIPAPQPSLAIPPPPSAGGANGSPVPTRRIIRPAINNVP
jgi:hypothetical protein